MRTGRIIGVVVGALILAAASFFQAARAAGVPQTFTPGQLIDDDSFLAKDSMSTSDVQRFLDSKRGRLATFSENGRSAAQIIWDAAHGYGEASGSANGIVINQTTGTVSPKVLLVTLQKEQSLITNPAPSQTALDWAMGYGCPDGGGCNLRYQGFTNQVEWAAWQFRYNHERAKGNFPDYQVGQTMTFSNTTYPYNPPPTQSVTLTNAATASLYRYTPHVYNGNYNFWSLYRQWFVRWAAELVGRSNNPAAPVGDSVDLMVQFKNVGEEPWQRNVVRLGTDRARDRVSDFAREDRTGGGGSGWVSNNRIELVDAPVGPGAVGTFRFFYTIPLGYPPGTYGEAFNLVADGIEWFPESGLSWDITALPLNDRFRTAWTSQSGYPFIPPSGSSQLEATFRNTGQDTWTKETVRLGTSRARDRTPGFGRGDGWISNNRIELVETSVPPGGVGTFRFYYTVPANLTPGVYREYFRPVADGIAWMEDWGVYWDVTVLQEGYHAAWTSQNAHPALAPSDSYRFEAKLQNVGSAAWTKGTVNLGTDRERDRSPQFTRADIPSGNPSGWTSTNRIELVETSVPPGGVGTFRFYYTVPANLTPGVYREYFRPVADGIAWMEDWGVYWDVTVHEPNPNYRTQTISQNTNPTLTINQSYQFEIQLRNMGTAAWPKGLVNLGTDRARDRTPVFARGDGWISNNRIELVETSVPPGGVGTFRFYYTVPANLVPGVYREYFRPVADGIAWMDDWGVYWDVTIQ